MKSLIIILLLSFSQDVFATAQIPDQLIYKGTTYHLNNNPLETYFKEHPKKRPEGDITSSALWRGYIATFTIEDQMLILKDIQVQVYEHEEGKEEWRPNVTLKSVLKEVFPEEKKLIIDWCSEILILPSGEIEDYVHHGYASTFEQYLLLEIKEGVLQETKAFDTAISYLEFKKEQLNRFQKTDAYQTYLVKWKEKYDYTKEEVDQILERGLFKYLDIFLD